MINDPEELDKTLMIAVQQALTNTTEKLLKELKKIIQTEIYDSNTPKTYERTYQFLDSWEMLSAKIVGKFTESEIWQEYSEMIWDENNGGLFQHGNAYRSALDGELSTLFNEGFKSGTTTMVGDSRDWETHFWDKFEIYINKNLELIFQKEMIGILGHNSAIISRI